MLALIVAATSWTPILGQVSKTMEERVSDLEKRTGGVQIEDGVTRITAPLEIYDTQGNLVASLTASDAEGLLSVGGKQRGYASIGTGSDGAGIVVLLDANRKACVRIGSPRGESGRGLFIMDRAASQSEAALFVQGAQPRLRIGKSDEGGITAAVGDAGAGLLSVRTADGDLGVVVGAVNHVRMGVHALGEHGSGGVSVYADTLGGNVRVMNPKGVPVGGLFSEEEGGGLVLTGPEGGDSVVDLGVRAGGGSVRVFSVGGSPTRAALEADDRTGGVMAYDADGKLAATMSAMPGGGSGRLQLRADGITVVEGGVNSEGGGEVRAGPRAPQAVGGLAIPYRIVGRK